MSDPVFGNIFNLNGGGSREVIVDPSRVTREEFEAATTFANVIWGTEGLAESLGPSWFLVHDPRFMRMERSWAKVEAGVLGGTRTKGISIVDALDMRSKIKLIEDPELYAEILGEGRHFRDAAIKAGMDPRRVHEDITQIWALIAQECPNYQRRNGTWNDEAQQLAKLLEDDLIGLIDDYAELAYSRDWVRMDTLEVVHKHEEIWNADSGTMVPVVAVEVDTIHKALVMRSMVRTTALRCMRNFPGIKAEEFEAVRLTDEESDAICRLLFKADYEKMYTVLPDIMNIVNRAKSVPYEEREGQELSGFRDEARVFIGKLKTGEIEPIVTPIEQNPEATASPSQMIDTLSRDPYAKGVFMVLQDMGERGDEEAAELVKALVDSPSYDLWGKIDDFLMKQGEHPYQHIFEGRELLTDEQVAQLTQEFLQTPIVVEGTEEDEIFHLTEEQAAKAVKVYAYIKAPMAVPYIAEEVRNNGAELSIPTMANNANRKRWADIEAGRIRNVTTVEETLAPTTE